MHYVKLHLGDWALGTKGLSLLERGVYLEMLSICYAEECGLPDDLKKICKMIGAHTASEKNAVKEILSKFFQVANGLWINPRVEKELSTYKDKSSKAAASAKERWDKTQQKTDANAMRTHSERNATQDPRPITQDTIKKDTKKKLQTSLTADFILSDDWKIFCHNNRPDLNPEEIFSQFKDYWLSNGDKKADWFATWRNWIRRQKQQLTGETEYQKSMRLRVEEISPNVARKDPAKFVKFTNFVDEVQNVIAIENN